jgi:protoheme IX farnesyltransferase
VLNPQASTGPSLGAPVQRKPSVLRDYIALTKPRIISLLLITATGGMFLASQGPPPLLLLALVLVGGSLAAGGANALNHFLDRDIDERMTRTAERPVPAGRVGARQALVFGIFLNAVAFAILALWVNLLSAGLTLGATLFYVLVYTIWLKRSTPQNIVIGGAAGAVPPLVGWAAVTGDVGLPALYLFAIVFFWTPPHFWALSLLLQGDYARAGIPMLPVVRGIPETARSIILHSALLVTISVLFITTRAVGLIYLVGAVGLGSVFLLFAWRLLRSGQMREARRLYIYSLLYLALLFVFLMVDSSVRW